MSKNEPVMASRDVADEALIDDETAPLVAKVSVALAQLQERVGATDGEMIVAGSLWVATCMDVITRPSDNKTVQ